MENKTVRRFASCALALGLVAAQAGVALAQDPATPPPAEVPPADAPPEIPPADTAPVAAEPAPVVEKKADVPGTITYDKGFKMVSGDGKFELKIVGRVQSRWEVAQTDEDDAEAISRFQIARARVTLEGKAYDVGYKFQTEFGKGFVFLRDFYLDVKLADKVKLRTGQWKRPFSRQQITSSGSLQLVDRAGTDRFFGAGRDIGVAVHNDYEKSADGVEWVVGVFNGSGDGSKFTTSCDQDPMTLEIDCTTGVPTNVPGDIGPTVVARVGYNSGGLKGYSESDLEGGKLRFGVAASYRGDLGELEDDAQTHVVDVDAMIKAEGFSGTAAFYLVKAGAEDVQIGFHAQAGYFLTPKKHEIAARFAQVPAAAAAGGAEVTDTVNEILAGFNWFGAGHSWKWQSDVGVLSTTTGDGVNQFVFRTQAQLVF